MIFCAFDDDGRILYHGDVPRNMVELQGKNIYQGKVNPLTHYIKCTMVNSTLENAAPLREISVVARPLMNPEFKGLTVTGLPPNGKVFINGKEYDYIGVTIEFDFPYVGEYAIEIQAWPYRNCTFTLRKE